MQNVSFSSTATTATNTSSIATTDMNTLMIDLPNEPIILTFEAKLSVLQLSHIATNAWIDELDTNLSSHIDSLDSSIKSFILTSNRNFRLLFAHFNVSSATSNDSSNSPNVTLSPPILEDMEVDTDSRKCDCTPHTGIAHQNLKKWFAPTSKHNSRIYVMCPILQYLQSVTGSLVYSPSHHITHHQLNCLTRPTSNPVLPWCLYNHCHFLW